MKSEDRPTDNACNEGNKTKQIMQVENEIVVVVVVIIIIIITEFVERPFPFEKGTRSALQ